MLNRYLLVLVVAGSVTVAASFAAAQYGPASNQQSSPSRDLSRWHDSPADSGRRAEGLTKQFKLTSDQQAKVQDIFESQRSQMKSVRQDSSLSQQARHAKMVEIHESTEAQIRAILDSNQQKQWDDMQAKHERWMQLKHPE